MQGTLAEPVAMVSFDVWQWQPGACPTLYGTRQHATFSTPHAYNGLRCQVAKFNSRSNPSLQIMISVHGFSSTVSLQRLLNQYILIWLSRFYGQPPCVYQIPWLRRSHYKQPTEEYIFIEAQAYYIDLPLFADRPPTKHFCGNISGLHFCYDCSCTQMLNYRYLQLYWTSIFVRKDMHITDWIYIMKCAIRIHRIDQNPITGWISDMWGLRNIAWFFLMLFFSFSVYVLM